jgi:enterochelin esterase family protein
MHKSTHPVLLALCALLLLASSAPRAAAGPDATGKRFFDRTGKIADPPFPTLAAFDAAVSQVAPGAAADAFWQQVVALGQMPLVFDDTAVFLFKGKTNSVSWTGDFNTWQASTALAGRRIGATDIWTARRTFPLDARLDYKVNVNSQPRLDPLNPLTQKGMYGKNSVLTMPRFTPSPWITPRTTGPRGTLSAAQVLQSRHLGYPKRFQVYTPAGFERMKDLPVLYVTDGHEYADPEMGALPVILDNLIADGKITPVIAVFIDPRKVDTGENRRGPELLTNPRFQWFLTQELIPWIDARYPTRPLAEARAIAGMSLGGLHATYTAMRQPEFFGMIAALSPYYKAKPAVLAEVEKNARTPGRFFVSQGTFDYDVANTRRLRQVLAAKAYPHRYIEVNDGHSWGNWRTVLDDMLVYFFGIGRR